MHRNSGSTSIRCSPSNLGTLRIQQPLRQGWIHQPSSVWLHHSEVVMAPPFSVWSSVHHDPSECINVLFSIFFHLVLLSYVLFHCCFYPVSCLVIVVIDFILRFLGSGRPVEMRTNQCFLKLQVAFFHQKLQDLMNFIVECGYFWNTSAPAIVTTPNGQIGTSNSSVTSATLAVSDVVVSLNEVSGCPKSHFPRLKRCWISPLEAPPLCLVLLLHPQYFPEDWMKPLNHFLASSHLIQICANIL